MKSFDLLAQDLIALYKKAHPEVSPADAGRYVIGVMSGLGHIILTLQDEVDETPEPPTGACVGRYLNVEGVTHETDFVWHRAHRCWVVIPAGLIGAPRVDTVGVASLPERVLFEKVRAQFGDSWNLQLTRDEGHTGLFVCGSQEMLAKYEGGVLTTSIKGQSGV